MVFAVILFGLGLGVHSLWMGVHSSTPHHIRGTLIRTRERILRLEALLTSGHYPSDADWKFTAEMSSPLEVWIERWLSDLRQAGARQVPILVLGRTTISQILDRIQFAEAETAGARAQIWVLGLLVPFAGIGLFVLFPELRTHLARNAGVVLVCSVWAAGAGVWLSRQVRWVQWGGLGRTDSEWIIWVPLTLQSIISRIQAGATPDLAWSAALSNLWQSAPRLAAHWAGSIWDRPDGNPVRTRGGEARLKDDLIRVGGEVRNGLGAALVEGRSGVDLLQQILKSTDATVNERMRTLLRTMGTRALLPLFLGVAPALLVLLVWMVVQLTGDLMGGVV